MYTLVFTGYNFGCTVSLVQQSTSCIHNLVKMRPGRGRGHSLVIITSSWGVPPSSEPYSNRSFVKWNSYIKIKTTTSNNDLTTQIKILILTYPSYSRLVRCKGFLNLKIVRPKLGHLKDVASCKLPYFGDMENDFLRLRLPHVGMRRLFGESMRKSIVQN